MMRFVLAALVVFVAVEESYAGYKKPCTPAYYGNWGKWSRCTRKCGDEDQYRTRKCFPGNCVYSTKCSGPNRQKRSCDLPCCPKDGYWTSWSKYGDCSKSCGGGRQCRSRRCVGRECYGRDCKGSSKDCRSCNDKCCPVDGKWSSWGKYGPCSKTCGGGTQSRSRRCEGRACGGAGCKGNSREQRKCNEDCCPQDGKFTPWGKWERCTKTCGGGTQLRARRCEGQKCGGKGCFGTVAQRRDCNKQCCPKDGSLSEWGRWSKCSKSCGGGSQSRHRACEGQACGGKGCDPYEPLYQSRSCGKKCCPVNGGWSSWSSFGKCSVTCGWGRKYRTRTCTYPAPKCGGRKCRGSNSQSADCDFPPCKKYY